MMRPASNAVPSLARGRSCAKRPAPFSQGYPAEVHGAKATAIPSTTLAFRPGVDRALWTYGLFRLSRLDHWNGIVQPKY